MRQVMRGRSHALLQEAGINLVALLEEEGFYVRRRIMTAPLARRGRASFGAAAPIELPTPRELQRFAEGCGAPTTGAEPVAGPPAVLALSPGARPDGVAAAHEGTALDTLESDCCSARQGPGRLQPGCVPAAGEPGVPLHRGRRHCPGDQPLPLLVGMC